MARAQHHARRKAAVLEAAARHAHQPPHTHCFAGAAVRGLLVVATRSIKRMLSVGGAPNGIVFRAAL
jgi:hypothetical protein